MGYSGRYHAASLAAVFIALAIGILIGASLGSDVISGASDDLEKSLGSDLDDARGQVKQLEAQLGDERDFENLIYPAVVGGRLPTQRVALIALGDVPDDVRDGVQAAIEPAGASLAEVAVVREPPDAGALIDSLLPDRAKIEPRGTSLSKAARIAGRVLVGAEPGFDALRDGLLSRFSGSQRSIDSIVVARYRPAGMSPREEADADTLEDSLIAGLRSTGLNVVGVELSDDEASSVAYYSDRGLATVDDLDAQAGKVALVAALDGAEGHFGVKESADSLLPDLIGRSGSAERAGSNGAG
jgi:hypothetical protein